MLGVIGSVCHARVLDASQAHVPPAPCWSPPVHEHVTSACCAMHAINTTVPLLLLLVVPFVGLGKPGAAPSWRLTQQSHHAAPPRHLGGACAAPRS
jgi:hypothetical protein